MSPTSRSCHLSPFSILQLHSSHRAKGAPIKEQTLSFRGLDTILQGIFISAGVLIGLSGSKPQVLSPQVPTGLGFRGTGFRVQGIGFRGTGFRVQGIGFSGTGLGYRV